MIIDYLCGYPCFADIKVTEKSMEQLIENKMSLIMSLLVQCLCISSLGIGEGRTNSCLNQCILGYRYKHTDWINISTVLAEQHD